eukprot:12086037-Alexandrium_andersonii.AAC.1
MPARIREVQEYLGGKRRKAAFKQWMARRRREAAQASREGAGGAGPQAAEAVLQPPMWNAVVYDCLLYTSPSPRD